MMSILKRLPPSKFTEEEFKQLAYMIHDDLYQRMFKLFEGLNQMKETYNAFERHSDVLHDHDQRRNEETKELNVEHTQKISTLEEKLKDFKLISVTSSFSKFTQE